MTFTAPLGARAITSASATSGERPPSFALMSALPSISTFPVPVTIHVVASSCPGDAVSLARRQRHRAAFEQLPQVEAGLGAPVREPRLGLLAADGLARRVERLHRPPLRAESVVHPRAESDYAECPREPRDDGAREALS